MLIIDPAHNLLHFLPLGSCYRINKDKIDAKKKPLFSFKNDVRYYQKAAKTGCKKAKDGCKKGFTSGAGIIGNGITRGKDDSFVFGSPNFSLGNPRIRCEKKDTQKEGECRYGGFGNLFKFGILDGIQDESGKITEILLNPSREKDRNYFRQGFKDEFTEKKAGTPSIYLGSTVTRGELIVKYTIYLI